MNLLTRPGGMPVAPPRPPARTDRPARRPANPPGDAPAMNLLTRLGGMLVAPRALLRHLPERTGARDGLLLLGLWTLAVALPPIGRAVAGSLALGDVPGLLQGLLPLVPWLVCAIAVEWCLGPPRAHRTGLCMTPLLLVGTVAHLLDLGPPLLGPADAATLVGCAATLALALAVRPAIPPTADRRPANLSPETADMSPGPATPDLSRRPASPDMSPGPAAPDLSPGPATPGRAVPRSAALVGLALLTLVGASAVRDGLALARGWTTLTPLVPGEALPQVRIPLLDGGALALGELPPQPHLLVFWTTWCGACRGEMPMLRALHARYADRGLRMILVNGDQDHDQADLAAAYRAQHDLGDIAVALDDGALRRAMRVRMYPTFVLVDAAGRAVRTHQGGIGERTLAAAIESVLPR